RTELKWTHDDANMHHMLCKKLSKSIAFLENSIVDILWWHIWEEQRCRQGKMTKAREREIVRRKKILCEIERNASIMREIDLIRHERSSRPARSFARSVVALIKILPRASVYRSVKKPPDGIPDGLHLVESRARAHATLSYLLAVLESALTYTHGASLGGRELPTNLSARQHVSFRESPRCAKTAKIRVKSEPKPSYAMDPADEQDVENPGGGSMANGTNGTNGANGQHQTPEGSLYQEDNDESDIDDEAQEEEELFSPPLQVNPQALDAAGASSLAHLNNFMHHPLLAKFRLERNDAEMLQGRNNLEVLQAAMSSNFGLFPYMSQPPPPSSHLPPQPLQNNHLQSSKKNLYFILVCEIIKMFVAK
ncbi:hypothetical protein DBV15_10931, partial [Temnothorax longispinosus]